MNTTAIDFSHLHAIQERLFRETQRLRCATTEAERAFRHRQVSQAEIEEAAEYRFLGIEPATVAELSDDELLAELIA